MTEYTYTEYLDAWAERFGDADEVECPNFLNGRRVDSSLQRLTEAEFEKHLKALAAANAAWRLAHDRNDDEGMCLALVAAYPHERVLLV